MGSSFSLGKNSRGQGRRVCEAGGTGERGSGDRKSGAERVERVDTEPQPRAVCFLVARELGAREQGHLCPNTRLSQQLLVWYKEVCQVSTEGTAGMQDPYPEEVSRQSGRKADTHVINTSAGSYTQRLRNREGMINFSAIHCSASSGKFPLSFPHPTDGSFSFSSWRAGHSSNSSSAPPFIILTFCKQPHQLSWLHFHSLREDCRISLSLSLISHLRYLRTSRKH